MSSNNEINFGPVFMRARKPAQLSSKKLSINQLPAPPQNHPLQISQPNQANIQSQSQNQNQIQTQNQNQVQNHNQSQTQAQAQAQAQTQTQNNNQISPRVPAPVLKPNLPSLGSFSPLPNNQSLPLSKSFSAVVSPANDLDDRQKYPQPQNGLDASSAHNYIPALNSIESSSLPVQNGIHSPSAIEYSREALLSLYSEHLAAKLPPDLEITDPAVSQDLVGPPLALIDLSDAEKELFAGPFNSERRTAANKSQLHHHNENTSSSPLSPETPNPPLSGSKLAVGGGVKLGKHSPIERFTSLGIQGGVLAGVASPSHSNLRRRGDNENDPPESARRFLRPEEAPSHSPTPWSANPRDRRARDSGPPTDGKWKRGVSLEEKALASLESSGGATNIKYSVLDKMREKAAAGLEAAPKEPAQTPSHDPPHQDVVPHDPSRQSSALFESDPRESQEAQLTHSPNVPPAPSPGNDKQDPVPSPQPLSAEPDPSHELTHRQDSAPTGTSSQQPSVNPPLPIDLAPEDIGWQYRDPSGTVQGPFTAFQMQEWYKATFFRDDLLVKRVIDAAFETLETLILRVGDRDRPFFARPPPALPPNLPLPSTHLHNHQLPHPLQPQGTLPNLMDSPVSTFAPRSEAPSVLDSSLPSHTGSIPNQHAPITAPDPWNTVAPTVSSLSHSGNLPASSSLVSGTAWNSGSPAYVQPNPLPANDFNPNMLANGLIPNSYAQPETLRFLQQIHHPALSMGTPNGYPFPLPHAHQPGFGQIPALHHHLANQPGLDPLLAAQLHSQLGLHPAPYSINPTMAPGGQVMDPLTEHERNDQVGNASNPTPVDPWQMQPEPVRSPTPLVSEQSVHNTAKAAKQAGPVELSRPPAKQDGWASTNVTGPLEPIGTRSSGKNTPTLVVQDLAVAPAAVTQLVPHEVEIKPTRTLAHEVAGGANNGALENQGTGSVTVARGGLASSLDKSVGEAHEDHVKSPEVSQASWVQTLSPESNSAKAIPDGAPTTGTQDQPWQNVSHQATAKTSPAVRGPTPLMSPPAGKQTGKVVVLSRVQQDEQDRRTASIQKTQQQLKEAQAVERAAREASQAAAAAALASVATPAPWSKDEKRGGAGLSLAEIQAGEARQAEKRRVVEKQAAASRVQAEQAAAAERAARAAREALPPAANWATTAAATSPTKQGPAPWGEGAGPRQSMRQIQEEEARKKRAAQVQLAKAGAARPGGGYAGSVVAAGSNKPVVSGPWSVVGAKSKVTAPPVRTSASMAVVPGLPGPARSGAVVAGVGGPGTKASSVTGTTGKVGVKVHTGGSAGGLIGNKESAGGQSSHGGGGSGAESAPPASPEFMKWLREALRGMNNVDDFVKMLLDFPINPDESVLEIVSDSVYAGSATLDGRRFAKEFNARRCADVNSRAAGGGKQLGVGGGGRGGGSGGVGGGQGSGLAVTVMATAGGASGGGNKKASTMAEAVKYQPVAKNDGWNFAVVGPKKKKK